MNFGDYTSTPIFLKSSAAARRYEISGDERFRDVVGFLPLRQSRTGRTYVTGGTSNGEGWLTQPHLLAAELKLQRRHGRVLLRV